MNSDLSTSSRRFRDLLRCEDVYTFAQETALSANYPQIGTYGRHILDFLAAQLQVHRLTLAFLASARVIADAVEAKSPTGTLLALAAHVAASAALMRIDFEAEEIFVDALAEHPVDLEAALLRVKKGSRVSGLFAARALFAAVENPTAHINIPGTHLRDLQDRIFRQLTTPQRAIVSNNDYGMSFSLLENPMRGRVQIEPIIDELATAPTLDLEGPPPTRRCTCERIYHSDGRTEINRSVSCLMHGYSSDDE